MPYSISELIVDGEQNVVALDWKYSNPEGTLGNQHKLLEPYGSTKLAAVTEEVAVGWLEEQIQNTSAQFDAELAKRKAAAEYDKTLVPYAPHPAGPPTPITMPAPEPESSVLPTGGDKRSKK